MRSLWRGAIGAAAAVLVLAACGRRALSPAAESASQPGVPGGEILYEPGRAPSITPGESSAERAARLPATPGSPPATIPTVGPAPGAGAVPGGYLPEGGLSPLAPSPLGLEPKPPASVPAEKPTLVARSGNDFWQVDDPAQIANLQRRLKNAGYFAGAVDGTVTAQLLASITRLQRAEGLPETGMLDARTAELLGMDNEREARLRFGARSAAGPVQRVSGRTRCP